MQNVAMFRPDSKLTVNSRLLGTHSTFAVFYCPNLVILAWVPTKYGTLLLVTHTLLRGQAFRDGWGKNGYLTYCCFSMKEFSGIYVFLAILYKPQTLFCGKIAADQQFMKYPQEPIWYQQSYRTQSHLNHLSPY